MPQIGPTTPSGHNLYFDDSGNLIIDGVTIAAASVAGTLTALGAAPLASPTFTGIVTSPNFNESVTAITATSNAATVPVAAGDAKVTNSSAATLTITMATATAVDGAVTTVRVYDFSAAAQTVAWVNTENSTVSAPTTSNGSTTLPLTVMFQFNSGSGKWRTILSV